MRPVRTFLAALALSAAAGCTRGDITAPQAPPAARHDDGVGGSAAGGIMDTGDGGPGISLPGDSTAAADRKGYIGSGG